ncbi:unnamed protein product [Peronospora belbahrii]|uniref:Uncharacterized protein n=1 Tax=Peronospora belbahrii TaxID=622444 RepID=A0AAU9L3T2_9STRA|nr:unnamed protein product [Peronospora belbahrii]CAH0518501.1 unnamed protein product [Peronospora belbahrii]
MTDAHDELLKCVLQLAASSDKLRTTNAILGTSLGRMQQALPESGMPLLTSKLAVIASNMDRKSRTLEEKFQEIYDLGTETTERMELTKTRVEKELRRRSENFRDLVKSRNTDIQEEYARMLKELDDQAELLDEQISKEREAVAARAERRRQEAIQRKSNKKQQLAEESAVLKAQLDEFTLEIRQLQEVFAALEHEHDDISQDAQSAEERRQLEEERAQNEIVELQQEIVLLKEVQKATVEKVDRQSLKAQYEEEKREVLEETAHLESLVEDFAPQINSNSVRLHSLLRTLAPAPGIGTLMTRLYQQLSSDSPAPSSTDLPPTPRKTVDLNAFLNSCPSFEEGNRAIDELKKLQLVHCYESSGIIALAD